MPIPPLLKKEERKEEVRDGGWRGGIVAERVVPPLGGFMRLRSLGLMFWLVMVAGLLAAPFLGERVFWYQLEQQAVQADVVEGNQE
jgi:hypothetical protein